LAAAISLEQQKFLEFQKKYNKVYSSHEEFQYRYQVFKTNLKKAAEHQQKNPKATFGVTKFSDLTDEEHKQFFRMVNADFSKFPTLPKKTDFSASKSQLSCSPDSTNYDWFADCSGSCTEVYNQGQCGSCWAFSATETIESYYALNTGAAIVGLSVEQIVDCDTAGQDQGCNGGFPTGAYQYVQSAGGLESSQQYPYTAEGGQSGTCQIGNNGSTNGTNGNNTGNFIATVSSYSSISGETGMYQQLSVSSGGPVSVCVDASSWSSYTGGVLTQCTDNVDHCVQTTGYSGYGSSGSYWIVRNSWGADWGEQGFIWVEIGQDLCAIGDYATVVVAAAASN